MWTGPGAHAEGFQGFDGVPEHPEMFTTLGSPKKRFGNISDRCIFTLYLLYCMDMIIDNDSLNTSFQSMMPHTIRTDYILEAIALG